MQHFDLYEWWQPLAVGLGAAALAWVVYRLSQPLVRRVTRHSPVLNAVALRLEPALKWLLPLIALELVWASLPDDLGGIDGMRHWTGIALIAAFTGAAIAAVRGVVDAVALLHPQDVADNLEARRVMTQARVLSRIAIAGLLLAGLAFMLMTFPRARQLGTSLLASAGLSALVIGIAAKSVFGNLLAGLQIALSQPIRIDDVLIVENEWGRVEEITGTYVVLKIWDERRLIIPLQWFIEHPFQNWTRTTSQIIGSVMLWVDYMTDLAPLRTEATRLAQSSQDYDGRVCLLQVVETSESAMQLRLIVSSPSAGQNWDLRCLLREGLIAFLQQHQPQALPRVRAELQQGTAPAQSGLPTGALSRPAEAQPAASAPGAQATGGSEVNTQTGMASLAAPTGGVTPPAAPPG
ncbi:MAG TPA: mechanosensitive ion channel domain-containing protein [Ideonella sp.]|uniref:mechanosensitive ion channel family protein n=1 Tax=Ideonella sp. TaxID=1929293 RepID=UPI002C88C2D5|nr:mechanosensitive ion channel domain-containing protein [Ideonella sp.]HSI51928.1 mechanosensitive ion channel domain-containing protein [Ideonella sp.]